MTQAVSTSGGSAFVENVTIIALRYRSVLRHCVTVGTTPLYNGSEAILESYFCDHDLPKRFYFLLERKQVDRCRARTRYIIGFLESSCLW